ncbi:MAG TPA: four helix bundle protein [Candidatus Nanoarchaeia archaeon]|nr:four helix bundle protein [Candidatus Nanoarchaeia archaeon]
MRQNYNDLEIFRLSYQFVLSLYPILNLFPESEHKNLVLQMKRAVVSLPLNIAEGSSRSGRREFLAFLTYAFGSGKELEVSLRLSKDLGFVDDASYVKLNEDLAKVMAKLASLIQYHEKELPASKMTAMLKADRGEPFLKSTT